MKKLTKILLGGAALLAGAAGVTCLAKKHNDEDEYVTTEIETDADVSDSEEEAE